MKTGSVTHKVPGGKLLRIDVQYDDHITAVKLTGDFFLHPEDTLDAITATLTGLPLPLETEKAVGLVQAALEENQAQLIGATPEDIVFTLQEALV